MNVSDVQPLHVQTSFGATENRPAPLSPMCGWQKVETSSPKKIVVVTPTKHRVKPDVEALPSPMTRELRPLCYSSDEAMTGPSPTKSESGRVSTDSSDDSGDNLLYFKVPDIHLKDLYDWSRRLNECRVTTVNPARGLITQKSSAGSKVEVNEELIALFRFDESVYAVIERCPHAGGPLHLGDIEVLPNSNSVCLICPWHSWKMDLANGKVLFPLNRSERARVFRTEVDEEGRIWIGFDRFSARYFNLTDNFHF